MESHDDTDLPPILSLDEMSLIRSLKENDSTVTEDDLQIAIKYSRSLDNMDPETKDDFGATVRAQLEKWKTRVDLVRLSMQVPSSVTLAARKSFAAVTDMKRNDADIEGDGDQSRFEALPGTPGGDAMNAWSDGLEINILFSPLSRDADRKALLPDDFEACGRCGKPSLKGCGRCAQTYFCSSECLLAAWPTHKIVCGKKTSSSSSSPPHTPLPAGHEITYSSTSEEEDAADKALSSSPAAQPRRPRHRPPFVYASYRYNLPLACYYGDFRAVRSQLSALSHSPALLQRYLKRRHLSLRITPLHLCVSGGRAVGQGNVAQRTGVDHVKTASLLLAAGADPAARDIMGYDSLYHCLTSSWSRTTMRIARLVLMAGANVNTYSRMGKYILQEAVMTNCLPVVNLLLEAGADPNFNPRKLDGLKIDAKSAPPEWRSSIDQLIKLMGDDFDTAANMAKPSNSAAAAAILDAKRRGRQQHGRGMTLEGQQVEVRGWREWWGKGQVLTCGEFDPVAARYSFVPPKGADRSWGEVNVPCSCVYHAASAMGKGKNFEDMSVKELKAAVQAAGLSAQTALFSEKREFVDLLKSAAAPPRIPGATSGGAAGNGAAKSTRSTCCVCASPSTTRCSRCRSQVYCSKECQTQDWKNGHKERCSKPPDADP